MLTISVIQKPTQCFKDLKPDNDEVFQNSKISDNFTFTKSESEINKTFSYKKCSKLAQTSQLDFYFYFFPAHKV